MADEWWKDGGAQDAMDDLFADTAAPFADATATDAKAPTTTATTATSTTSTTPSTPSTPTPSTAFVKNTQVHALYTYTAKADDELSVQKGDLLVVLDTPSPGWLAIRSLLTGESGLLPDNYVAATTAHSRSKVKVPETAKAPHTAKAKADATEARTRSIPPRKKRTISFDPAVVPASSVAAPDRDGGAGSDGQGDGELVDDDLVSTSPLGDLDLEAFVNTIANALNKPVEKAAKWLATLRSNDYDEVQDLVYALQRGYSPSDLGISRLVVDAMREWFADNLGEIFAAAPGADSMGSASARAATVAAFRRPPTARVDSEVAAKERLGFPCRLCDCSAYFGSKVVALCLRCKHDPDAHAAPPSAAGLNLDDKPPALFPGAAPDRDAYHFDLLGDDYDRPSKANLMTLLPDAQPDTTSPWGEELDSDEDFDEFDKLFGNAQLRPGALAVKANEPALAAKSAPTALAGLPEAMRKPALATRMGVVVWLATEFRTPEERLMAYWRAQGHTVHAQRKAHAAMAIVRASGLSSVAVIIARQTRDEGLALLRDIRSDRNYDDVRIVVHMRGLGDNPEALAKYTAAGVNALADSYDDVDAQIQVFGSGGSALDTPARGPAPKPATDDAPADAPPADPDAPPRPTTASTVLVVGHAAGPEWRSMLHDWTPAAIVGAPTLSHSRVRLTLQTCSDVCLVLSHPDVDEALDMAHKVVRYTSKANSLSRFFLIALTAHSHRGHVDAFVAANCALVNSLPALSACVSAFLTPCAWRDCPQPRMALNGVLYDYCSREHYDAAQDAASSSDSDNETAASKPSGVSDKPTGARGWSAPSASRWAAKGSKWGRPPPSKGGLTDSPAATAAAGGSAKAKGKGKGKAKAKGKGKSKAKSKTKGKTKGNAPPGGFLTLEQLKNGPLPDGMDHTAKEVYLSDEDFEAALGCSREEFAAMPAWRRELAKRKIGLF
ncbi:uncharacterized protein AMSG_08672 [Thecamonas trahens ATCC 50062]|uniref:SH3 domain-containing protein n=1 Tax=Thecamonas trahens ATCC 50062 TaxID=461836 RepID=A0A0L0DMZ1_THETB|nr:hypothetical protein AMSG_08672 [Thecamonas trahens ATCC 50062]KNC52783.1 hypothetical protein AMSG_08672 [Thecamonas trahens ATCC 50062]|eukprot:XP_013755093.1 hypothetical protein AMSG_08672 [Thecamonas trahens ATCC 50062]